MYSPLMNYLMVLLFSNAQDQSNLLQLKESKYKMGVKNSKQQNSRFHFIDGNDIQQNGFIPVNQKTSLQPRKQRSYTSYQGPGQGQQGQYTGLNQFMVPQKYRKAMQQDPLKCSDSDLKGDSQFDPYLFKKSLNVYYGEWMKGKPHGYGKIFNPDRDFYYQGYFQEGLPSFYGVFLTNQVQYRGQIKYGYAQGKGQYKQGKTTIQGYFKQNFPHKDCVETSHNYLYQGDYENGTWKKGKLSWNSQTLLYQGQFQKGIINGQGTLTTLQYTYQGSFCHGKKHGLGKIAWKTGQAYNGQFQQDEITGKGEFYKNQIFVYRGQFKIGKANGQGCLSQNDRSIYAVWKDGEAQQIT